MLILKKFLNLNDTFSLQKAQAKCLKIQLNFSTQKQTKCVKFSSSKAKFHNLCSKAYDFSVIKARI